MTWKTHIIGGLQAGLIVAAVTHSTGSTAAIEIGTAVIGSVLPDIDHPEAKISRVDYGLSLVSKMVSSVTKHRRATHTVWCSALFSLLALAFFYVASSASVTGFALLLALVIMLLVDFAGLKAGSILAIISIFLSPAFLGKVSISIDPSIVIPCTIAMFFGCIAHLVYDTFNPQGIMWLNPLSRKRFSIGNIQTDSKGERAFGIFMFLITIILFIIAMPVAIPTLPDMY